jgi:hypothetical protein
VLTRVAVGGREAIEASIAAAKDSEVVEPTDDQKAALKKALREATAKAGVNPDEKPAEGGKPATAEELLPLVSFWADHDKRESERREDEKARREEALDELELLLWYSYWTAPYDPEHPDLVARRAYWPRRVGGLVVYGPGAAGAAPFIERYRPAIIVRPDDWRCSRGRVYLRVPAASGEAWLRWSF